MKVTQEKLPDSQIGLEIEISPEISQKAYDTVLKEFSRSASIPGFRKGKVPRTVLLQRLGASRIKAAAVEEMIQGCIEEAIKQEDIKALGNYKLRSSFEELVLEFEPGKPLTFSASVDVPPEVTVTGYQGLSIRAEEVKYDPADVDKFLEERRKEQATLIPVESRPAALGDVAVVDYSGKVIGPDGEPELIQGGQAEDFQIEILEGQFVKGFLEGIVGMNVGETKEVPVQFPDEYANEDLAGKSAVFTITLKELKEKELPQLDDDFAQAVSEFQTLAELRQSVESQYQDKADRETKANKQEALLNELVKLVQVELPETMISREVDNLLQQAAMRLSNYGIDVKKLYTRENIGQMRQQYREEAIKKLKTSLGLKQVVKLEGLEVEAAEVEAKVAELKPQLPQDIDPDRLRELITDQLLEEKAINWLEEKANIELLPLGTLAAEQRAAEASNPEPEAETTPASEPTE
ncbi:trigger factor [[Phormidium] sp. ETS-05]|uniref:trigger factor n=1 Tax=[Phormidium] sp. ETS-05 TaxID=222819 RepID=UPI0018EED99A|nr:trigger factor [[Phormidium] sp. ETS-05]